MDIEDAVPERRNLLMMSMAFIVYYGAGGSIASNELQLMALNIKFTRPIFISITAWTLLFWFALRFFQKTGFSVFDLVKQEVSRSKIPESLRVWVNHKSMKMAEDGLINRYGKIIEASGISTGKPNWSVICHHFAGPSSGGLVLGTTEVPLTGIRGLIYKTYFLARAISSENAFAEHFIPYATFVTAALSPAWSLML